MDMRYVGKASTLVIIIGVILVILSTVTSFLPTLIEDAALADTLDLVDTVVTYLALVLFLGLYAFAALRAVRKFGLDVMGAGMVSAMSYAVVGVFHLLINMVVELLIVNKAITIDGFRTAESALAASLLGDIAPDSGGVLIASLCGVGIIAVGFMMNFIIGSVVAIVSRHMARR